jgi:hypothetical protein
MGERPKKSKKPSGTRAEQLLEQSTFYVDECLGRQIVLDLRAAGMLIEAWHDHFPSGTDDVDWLPVVGSRAWVVLTKDKAIRRKPWELEKVITAGVRMFTLPNGKMNGGDMTKMFLDNRLRMGRALNKNRFPFVAVVSSSGVEIVRCGEVKTTTLNAKSTDNQTEQFWGKSCRSEAGGASEAKPRL